MDRYQERIQHTELIGGIIAAAVRNYSYHLPDKAVSPSVFMPNYRSKQEARQEKPKRLNRRKIAHNVRSFFREQMQTRPN